MPPLVSILIPLYNHEHFIAKCLDSVLEDTYPDKEIVIIDDGSKDSSAEVVMQWRSAQSESLPCSFTFISRENRGVTSTLNELVALAQGGLLAILASDDYLLPGGIEARTNYLEQNRDKLAVIGDCKLVDYQGELDRQKAPAL
jgi:glycosyltransferase involved in cell wall biosynthesis